MANITASEPFVRLTDRAQAKIRNLMSARGGTGSVVRLYAEATPGGTTEFGLSFDRKTPSDRMLVAEGLELAIDPQSGRTIRNLVIDYVESAGTRAFTFHPMPVAEREVFPNSSSERQSNGETGAISNLTQTRT